MTRRRIGSIFFLIAGLVVALYLGKLGPQEQHVRIVLGSKAAEVTALEVQYSTKDAPDPVRETKFTFPPGKAPRVVSHEPQLAHGDYRVQIEVDAQGGRRALQRQVTLGGGSTQIDISNALGRDDKPQE